MLNKININRKGIIQLPAGNAKPGASLASFNIDMPRFCREFNDKTKNLKNDINPIPISVFITSYKDKTFDFKIKTSPTTFLLKQALKIDKGSSNSKLTKVGTINILKITEIAKIKLPDLNSYSLENAIKIILGTAKNMGINIDF